MEQLILKNRDLLIDMKAQDHDHFQKMEKNQNSIQTKMNIVTNKVIVLLLLVGIILGINLCYYKDIVLENIQSATNVVRFVMKVGSN